MEHQSKDQSRETKLFNMTLLLLAGLAVFAALWEVATSRFRSGTDDLFFVLVTLLVALLFATPPILFGIRTGWFHEKFVIDDEPAAHDAHAGAHAGAHAEGHAEGHGAEDEAHGGSNLLFILVWIALLGLTALEVFLGYKQLRKDIMLTVLMGASIIKAALIVAYFMHMRFERMSLVLTIVPATVICLSLMLILFPDSFRLFNLR